uniref:Major facilitator superfamily (MFS) profile domain-containing protein n=1 Tax=Bionectria ochroleuca TaxID=29856 RepID=A0A8H7TSM7_BIOOC
MTLNDSKPEKQGANSDVEAAKESPDQDSQYPTGVRFALIMTSVYVCMFLVSLDRMIITTAIPEITNQFHSINDIGWYSSAYLLTTCALQLLFGKVYAFFNAKATLLSTIFLFEVGSAICGAAPNSIAFIIGRAIAGLGSAGIMTGVLMTIVNTVPLPKRPMYQGLFGAVFGISSIIGPLLGGAFTSNVTWRWCFYINLPVGGVAMVVVFFLMKIPDRDSTKIPTKEKLLQLDFYGSILVIAACVCLVLALQWGGVTYAWNNGRMIALLVMASVLFLSFGLVQVYLPRTATLPPRVIKQRSIIAGMISSFCVGSQQMIFIYYLPIYFQAIQGVSAMQSGIRLLPLLLSMVVSTLATGGFTRITGYYTPFQIIGTVLMSIGAGLLTTLQVHSSSGVWIGYQVIYGFGMGMDVPIGASFMFFTQLLGGSIFSAVGQTVFNDQLQRRLSNLEGFDPKFIQSNGATSLTEVPDSIKDVVLERYNEAIRQVLRVGMILVCITIIGALLMEWRSVKDGGAKQDENKEKAPVADEEKLEK